MKNSRRISLIILLLALAFLLVFLFRAFLLENFVRPVALVFWLLWQVLQSFDQRVVWSMLIFVALIYVVIRLNVQGLANTRPAPEPDFQLTLANIAYWRSFILMAASEKLQINTLKQSLVKMLVAMYTSSQPDTPLWEVADALRLRQIPLPDNIYAFLFPPEPLPGRPSFRQLLQALWRLPAVWANRLSGRSTADYYRSLDEVLAFMESSLEIKHADK